MSSSAQGLPHGWASTSLGSIAHVESGQSPPSSSYTDDPSDPPFLQGNAEFGDLVPSPTKRTSAPTKFASEDAVLLSVRAPVGATNLSPYQVAIGRGLAAVEPLGGIDRRFLLWLLRYKRSELERQATGTTFSAVTGPVVRNLPVALPPLAEQVRIVSIVESQMASLTEGREALESAGRGLRLYREAVVTAAVSGQLSDPLEERHDAGELLTRIREKREARWTKHALGRYKPAAEPSPCQLELPSHWTWATVDELAVGVQYGSSSKTSSDEQGVPVLRMGNIVDGELDFASLKFLPNNHEEFPALLLEEGDLLFNRTNSPELVGKTAVFRGSPSPCSFASYLIRVRFAPEVSPDYVSYFINSPFGRQWVKENVSQQVGQANVNGSKLRELTIPLPPENEQRRIVAAVNASLASASELRMSLRRAAAESDECQRSLLHRAFSGRLSTSCADDDSAHGLLQLIESQLGSQRRSRVGKVRAEEYA